MTDFFATLKTAAHNRAQYNRTMAALKAMPRETMIDFDIAPNDFARLAQTAVYGK